MLAVCNPGSQCKFTPWACGVGVQGLQMFGEDKLKASDWLFIQQAEQDAQADRMVVLSDVWLDKPEVLDSLHTVFAGSAL